MHSKEVAVTPACFFCDQTVAEKDAKLTPHGRVYGPCCADLVHPEDEPLVCPGCGAVNPDVEEHSSPGFTGAAIYWTDFACCGHQEVDASGDNLEAAR
jgi:hypothetical protein